jgi:uncharacterized protein (TIRG00374 family)
MKAMDAAGPGDEPHTKRRWIPRNVKITLLVLVVFFVIEVVLPPELHSARKEFHQLNHLNFLWLVLGAAVEIASLAAYAELTHTVLSPGAPNRFRLFRINMWALAVSHVLPGGTVPGTAVSYRLLTDSGVEPNTAAFGLATQGIGSAVVLNILFWLALLISIPLNGYNPYYGFAAILGVLLLSIFGGLVVLLTRGEKQADHFLNRIASHIPFVKPQALSALVKKVADRMKVLAENPQLLYRASIWAAANWLLDAGSLWIFLFAFGAHVSPVDLLVAYGLANILAVIPITPGGLGIVEFISISTLTGFGVSAGAATAGVLCWRLVNFWLPIPFGGVSYLTLWRNRSRLAAGSHPSPGSSGSGSSGMPDTDAMPPGLVN